MAVLLFVLLAAPAIVAWWFGRALIESAKAGRPTLPEEWLAHQRRVTGVFAFSAAIVGILSYDRLSGIGYLGSLVVAALAAAAGGFSARRVVLEERWEAPAYLAHLVRVMVATAGFWISLAAAPLIVLAGGDRWAWPVAAAVLVVLTVWRSRYRAIMLRVIGAAPLEAERADLLPVLAAITAKSTAEPPTLHAAGPTDGNFANAFAVPASRSPAVVFTRTLLGALSVDEIAAIHAHELAHLEHYQGRRLVRAAVLEQAAVLLGALMVPLAPDEWAGTVSIAAGLWFPATLLALGSIASAHKAHEAESDLRAIELCGDPEALIRALTKQSALARLPRRWAADFEQHATHPSLAHRIQAIRRAQGQSVPAPPGGPVVLRAARAPERAALAAVILDADRAHLLEGLGPSAPADAGADALRRAAGVCRSFLYSELVELRIDVDRKGTRLVVAARDGARWVLPLLADRPGELAAAQAFLDAVDVRLSAPTKKLAPWDSVGTLAATAIALIALAIVSSIPVALLALLATFRASAVTVAAAGAAALAEAGLSLRPRVIPAVLTAPVGPDDAALWNVLLAALAGLTLLSAERRRRVEPDGRRRFFGLAAAAAGVVALPGAFAMASALASLDPASGAALAARGSNGVVIGGFALAAAVLASGVRGSVPGSVALGGLATAIALMGSDVVLERMSTDPFIRGARAIPIGTVRATIAGRIALPEGSSAYGAGAVEWSPSEERVAVRFVTETSTAGAAGELEDPAHEVDGVDPEVSIAYSPRWSFGIARRASPTIETVFSGSVLAFIDDSRVLILVPGGAGGSWLEERAVSDPSAIRWRAQVPTLISPSLTLDARSNAFRLSGRTISGKSLVRIAGTIGADHREETRWKLPPPAELVIGASWIGGGTRALVTGFRRDELVGEGDGVHWIWLVLRPPAIENALWTLEPDGSHERIFRSSLAFTCLPPGFLDEEIVCASWSAGAGIGSSLVDVGLAGPRAAVRLGAEVEAYGGARGPTGVVAAWTTKGEVVLVSPERDRAQIVEILDAEDHPLTFGGALGIGPRRLAVLTSAEEPELLILELE